MTKFNSRFLSFRNILIILSILSIVTDGYADDWDVAQLMQLLAQNQSAHSGFVETKSIAILDKPVISSGELFYTAPDHLEKRHDRVRGEWRQRFLRPGEATLETSGVLPRASALIITILPSNRAQRKSLLHKLSIVNMFTL